MEMGLQVNVAVIGASGWLKGVLGPYLKRVTPPFSHIKVCLQVLGSGFEKLSCITAGLIMGG